MTDSNEVMTHLKSGNGFWGWQMRKISHIKNGISFCSKKLSLKIQFEITYKHKEYQIITKRKNLLGEKILKKLEAVPSSELHRKIEELIYSSETKMA